MEKEDFDVEHLQKSTYQRCKTWATLLENINKRETFDEWEISDLDSIVCMGKEASDSSDELASMEDNNDEVSQLNVELFNNVGNASRLNLFLNNTTIALAETTTKEDAEFLDLFNQTMPVIYEHNRQLKETGFDNVLSTFDKHKIEEKVGSWLSRHNSLFGCDSLMTTVAVKEEGSNYEYVNGDKEYKRNTRSCKTPGPKRLAESYDSDDSLQSGETARYIRSSRATKYVKKSTSKTLIKTHCLLKSARDTLKEKHACQNHNDGYLNTIGCHKITDKYECRPECNKLRKKSLKHKYTSEIAASEAKQRRKVLRKRTSSHCYKLEDSSDSDYFDDYIEHIACRNLTNCCHTNHCSPGYNSCATVKVKSARKLPLARINRGYYYFQRLSKSLSSSSSSSSTSLNTVNKSLIKKTKRKSNTIDKRPYKRTSECKCCDDRKPCQKYKQVTDSTSENDCYFEHNDNEVTQIKSNQHKKSQANMKTSSAQLRSSKTNTNTKEATFFSTTQIQVVCNSTAMSSNSPANKRQIANKLPHEQQHKKATKKNLPTKRKKDNQSENIAKQKSFTTSYNKNKSSSNTIVTSTSTRPLPSSSAKQSFVEDNSLTVVISDDEKSDSALVTSTTNPNLLGESKGILIYTPKNPSLDSAYQSTSSESYFTITKEHLSATLGEKLAEKFLKYYIGRKRFNINSTIYYIPPKSKQFANISCSSGSDDCLDNLGQYGDLYECF